MNHPMHKNKVKYANDVEEEETVPKIGDLYVYTFMCVDAKYIVYSAAAAAIGSLALLN